jgi:hypothetical protein
MSSSSPSGVVSCAVMVVIVFSRGVEEQGRRGQRPPPVRSRLTPFTSGTREERLVHSWVIHLRLPPPVGGEDFYLRDACTM